MISPLHSGPALKLVALIGLLKLITPSPAFWKALLNLPAFDLGGVTIVPAALDGLALEALTFFAEDLAFLVRDLLGDAASFASC